MNNPIGQPTKIHLTQTQEHREGYANSVQFRVNLWDFFLMFGAIQQTLPDEVTLQNFQGVYLSPSRPCPCRPRRSALG